MITVLTGGTGGAKFTQGLMQVVPPHNLTFVVNTGDDLRWWGLQVSPDVDSIVYALSGLLSHERGWGVEADTFQCLEMMRRLGAPAWFQLGDRDLATHLTRTSLLAQGHTLSRATAEIVERLGIEARVLPMSDDAVETRVFTAAGDLSFEEYFVRERHQVEPLSVRFEGAEDSHAGPGVCEAILHAEAVVIAPSNPVTSIGPILAVPGVRAALQQTAAPVVAVSPIVAGAAVSGPAGTLMKTQGLPVSCSGVALAYRDFLDVLVIDRRDAAEARQLEQMQVRTHVAETVMRSPEDKARLAQAALDAARAAAGAAVP